MSPASPAIRRALEADAPAVEALLPRRDAATGEHALFVIETGGIVVGALQLSQPADHLVIERIAVAEDHRGKGHGKLLIAFAEAAAREVEVEEIHLGPGIERDGFFTALDYVEGRKQIRGGALHLARLHLEAVGVPLLRDGTAPLARTIYYRAVWIIVAMIAAIGGLSLAFLAGEQITMAHLAGAALLCLVGTLFAIWQLVLIVVAARRGGRTPSSWLAMTGAAVALIAIGLTLGSRALPQAAQLWALYNAKAQPYAFTLGVSGDTLTLEGTIGSGTALALRHALDEQPTLRRIVLSGSGGQYAPAYEIEGLIRKRRLDTRVEGACTEACALAFLGGVERSLSPQARLGFRQAGSGDMNQAEKVESNRAMVRFLVVQAGLAPAFANRVVETPPNEVWLPTTEELIAGRVLQRVREK